MTLQAKIGAALILAVILTVFSVLGTQQVLTWKHGAEVGESRGETLKATSGIINDGQRQAQSNTRAEQGVTGARASYTAAKQEAKANEPETVDWADRPVPRSLRDAARERRRARERSGCAQGECPYRIESEDAVQREGVLRRTRDNE